jgi:predicted nucleotidyltransferase
LEGAPRIALVERNRDQVAALCDRYGVSRLDLFGSAVTGDFSETSDLDFVASFADADQPGYADRYLDFAEALEGLFGRRVDLLTERAIRNPDFRWEIESTRWVVYDKPLIGCRTEASPSPGRVSARTLRSRRRCRRGTGFLRH